MILTVLEQEMSQTWINEMLLYCILDAHEHNKTWQPLVKIQRLVNWKVNCIIIYIIIYKHLTQCQIPVAPQQTVSSKANITGTGHLFCSVINLFHSAIAFFIWGSHVSVVDVVHEDLCLQHREECGYALGICEVKCAVTCHDIHHTVRDVLFWEDQPRYGSNGQYAVGFAHNDHRAEEWSCLKKSVGVFRRLKHKKKNDHKTIHCLETMVK